MAKQIITLQYLINKRNYCKKVILTCGFYACQFDLDYRLSKSAAESHNPKTGLERILYFLFYFLIFTIPWAMVAYGIHIFRFIYYQISIWHYKKKLKKEREESVHYTVKSQDETDLLEYGRFVG